jgi:uncharacterized RDD family membrane protein YckC
LPYCKNCGTQELQDQSFCATCGTPTKANAAGETALPYFPMDPLETTTIPNLASFWRRFSGFLIDSILVGAVNLILVRHLTSSVTTDSLLTVLVAFIYGDFFMAFGGGQTLGMRMVGTRAVNEADQARVTPLQALRRALAYSFFLLIASLYHAHTTMVNGVKTLPENELLLVYLFSVPHFLDLLWVAWDGKNQSLHDKFAGTVVVRTKPSTPRS